MAGNAVMIVSIEEAISLLRAGHVVALPTETVYGLAASIHDPRAINNIFEVKNRPASNPLIVHIGSPNMLPLFARFIPKYVYKLTDAFWPGGLTIVLKKNSTISGDVCAGQDTVALRMPGNEIFLKILAETNTPLAAPSANPSQRISSTHHQHVESLFSSRVPVVAGGSCRVGIESTIIDATNNDLIEILRPGAISAQDIEAVSNIKCKTREGNFISPGSSKKHYSPLKKTFLVSNQLINKKINIFLNHAIIISRTLKFLPGKVINMPLKPEHYAKKIYDSLIQADSMDGDSIIIEQPPQTSRWHYINDRLKRAAHKIL